MVVQPASNHSPSSSSSPSSSDDDEITSTEQSMTMLTSAKSTQMETNKPNWRDNRSIVDCHQTESVVSSYNVDSSINSKDLVVSVNPSFNNQSKQINQSK